MRTTPVVGAKRARASSAGISKLLEMERALRDGLLQRQDDQEQEPLIQDNGDKGDTRTREELLAALRERDAQIVKLQAELKAAKAARKPLAENGACATAPPPPVDQAKVRASAERLKEIIYRGIKSQMKWKPSCKGPNGARWTWSGLCDEATYRELRGLKTSQKAKGVRLTPDEFGGMIGGLPSASIRYNHLYVVGKTVNISYANGELKISGSYGC